jgi:hypothetical protein
MEFFRNLSKKRRDRVAFLDFVEQSEDALRELDASNDAAWGFRNAIRSPGPQPGTIRFSCQDGRIITARVQMVGTLNIETGAWQWAWDVPSISSALTSAADKARAFGAQKRMERLTIPRFLATPIEAWGYCAVTCAIAKARGAFTERKGPGLIYFIFDGVIIPDARPSASAAYNPTTPVPR